MNKIEWKHYYSIGVPEIDEQHKKLTDIINELIAARNDDREEEVLGKILKSLVEYTQVHFSSEEKHMKQYNYPGLIEHQHQHKALIGQIVKILEEVREGKQAIGDELFTLLKNWLLKHILEQDREYGFYLKER